LSVPYLKLRYWWFGKLHQIMETTYTQARADLKFLLDKGIEDREQVIIHRREGEDVALIAAPRRGKASCHPGLLPFGRSPG